MKDQTALFEFAEGRKDLLETSREIYNRAVTEYKPYAICLMFSGGDDSLTTLHVALQLGIKFDLIIHGITGTGITETHDFVKKTVETIPFKYVESNAGSVYTDYVLRKGFFGVGDGAHEFTYHLLKAGPFRKVISKHIRQGKRGRNILLINGARRLESENRKKTMINPIKPDPTQPTNIWVNLINEWPDHSCSEYLEANGIERNPVSKVLCRSGECLCGSQQQLGDGFEAAAHFPVWGKWWKDLRQAVRDKGFSWDWSEPLPKGVALERKGQLNMFFQPMCSGCKLNYESAVAANSNNASCKM